MKSRHEMSPGPNRLVAMPYPVIPCPAPTPVNRTLGRCRTSRTHIATGLAALDCLVPARGLATCGDIPCVHDSADTSARCGRKRRRLQNEETSATGATNVRAPRVGVPRVRVAHLPIPVSQGTCLLQL